MRDASGARPSGLAATAAGEAPLPSPSLPMVEFDIVQGQKGPASANVRPV